MTRVLLALFFAFFFRDPPRHVPAAISEHDVLSPADGEVLVGIIAYSDVLSALSSRLSKSAPEENVILHQLPAWRIMRGKTPLEWRFADRATAQQFLQQLKQPKDIPQ